MAGPGIDMIDRVTKQLGENLYSNDMVDSSGRINELNEPKDRRASRFAEQIASQAMGGDGASAMAPSHYYSRKSGGAAAAAGEEGGLFARYRAYRKLLKEKYPLIRWNKVLSAPKIGTSFLKYKIYNYISESTESSTSILGNLVNGLAGGMALANKQIYNTLPFDIFPRLKVFTVYSNGATDIERVYTARHGGNEIPIFFQKMDADLPTNDALTEAADFVDQYGISPLNKDRSIGDFVDRDMKAYGLDKVMRGDYSKYFKDEPAKIHSGVTKSESGAIKNANLRDYANEANLPFNLQGRVKIYKEPGKKSGVFYRLGQLMGDSTPSSWKMAWNWIVTDFCYDVIDLPFGIAEATMTKMNLPVEAIRPVQEAEWNIATRMARGIQHEHGYTFEPAGHNTAYVDRVARAARAMGQN